MPSEQEIQNYLRHLSPVLTSALPPSDRSCPICYECYLEQTVPVNSIGTSDTSEQPVIVRSTQTNSRCRHVFGRHCIESHFRSGGPWCTNCPVCRESWFEHEDDDFLLHFDAEQIYQDSLNEDFSERQLLAEFSREHLGEQFDAEEQLANSPNQNLSAEEIFPDAPPRHFTGEERLTNSAVVNANNTVRIQIPQPIEFSIPQSPGVVSTNQVRETPEPLAVQIVNTSVNREVLSAETLNSRNRTRINRSIAILGRMLMTSEIDVTDTNTDARVMGLERAIENLWGSLEARENGWNQVIVTGGPRILYA